MQDLSSACCDVLLLSWFIWFGLSIHAIIPSFYNSPEAYLLTLLLAWLLSDTARVFQWHSCFFVFVLCFKVCQ